MDDRADKICDALEVSREEAFFYLEGFRGDVDAALEACRNKTLPLPSPTVESASEAPPLMTDSGGSSNQPPGPQQEQPPQSRHELIESFCEAALGANPNEALKYLERNNWNIQLAVGDFLDECRPTPSQMKSNRQIHHRPPPIGPSDAPLRIGGSNPQDTLMRLKSEESKLESQLMELRGLKSQLMPPSMGSFNLTPVKISSSSSSAMEVDPPESRNEAPEERIFQAIPLNIQNTQGSRNRRLTREENLSRPIELWVDQICDEASVCREEALFYLEGFSWKFDTAMEACRSKTMPPVKETAEAPPPNSQSQSHNEQLIRSFQEVAVKTTRDEAIAYLTASNWDVNQAVTFFIEGLSLEEVDTALSMSWMQRRDVPLSAMGLPSQSQFQASCNQVYRKEGEIGSSSSSINAGEENVTVAITGTASSQVDGMVIEEEDSSTTVVRAPTAPTTITITIVLADDGSGISINLPFRSNETVRDIRNAIDERTPDNERDYYLQSVTGEDYRDMNTTVDKISRGGSKVLLQVFPDP